MSELCKPIEILLVEDNEGDVFLAKKAFAKSKIANTINVAPDGEIAMDFLKKRNGYEDVARPDIIFLDINLPKKDGKQVLEEIRNDEFLNGIPVVILTSSQAEQDVLKSYDLHANAYVIKPIDFAKFQNIVSVIEDFWFTIVVYPKR